MLVALPVAPVAGSLAAYVGLLGRLPHEGAIHWDLHGRPDTGVPRWLLPLTVVVMALLASVALRPDQEDGSVVGWFVVGGLLSGVVWQVLVTNLDVPDWREAALTLRQVLIFMAGVAGFGGLGWWLSRALAATPPP